MSIVRSIDAVTAWVEREVCSQIELKLPPSGKQPETAAYDYQLVHPGAFSMYIPAKDKAAPAVKPKIPSICVRLLRGSDQVLKGIRHMSMQLAFSAWSPGQHAQDVLQQEPENLPPAFQPPSLIHL